MYHIFFFQSVIDGHLGWFYVFAIVNSAAMNVHVHVSLRENDLHFSGYTPSNGIAGSNDSSAFTLWGIAILLSTMVELIYTPTNNVKVFLFLHILSNICCPQIF